MVDVKQAFGLTDGQHLQCSCHFDDWIKDPPTYEAIVKTFGEVVDCYEPDAEGYSGDTFYLLRKGDEYGRLIIGWGSCSGCDALEWALREGVDSLQELADELEHEIVWDSLAGQLQFFESRPSLDLPWDEWERYIERAIGVLAGEVVTNGAV